MYCIQWASKIVFQGQKVCGRGLSSQNKYVSYCYGWRNLCVPLEDDSKHDSLHPVNKTPLVEEHTICLIWSKNKIKAELHHSYFLVEDSLKLISFDQQNGVSCATESTRVAYNLIATIFTQHLISEIILNIVMVFVFNLHSQEGYHSNNVKRRYDFVLCLLFAMILNSSKILLWQ